MRFYSEIRKLRNPKYRKILYKCSETHTKKGDKCIFTEKLSFEFLSFLCEDAWLFGFRKVLAFFSSRNSGDAFSGRLMDFYSLGRKWQKPAQVARSGRKMSFSSTQFRQYIEISCSPDFHILYG
jgi:hypothetical protein